MENDTNERSLEDKSIGGIVEGKYKFTIPSYQRGYRWGEREVEELLNDVFCHANEQKFFEVTKGKKTSRKKRKEIKNKKFKRYYLQPIVVKKTEKQEYEVIDGQQRLTTIYLLYKYFCDNKVGDSCNQSPQYTISYDAREKSWNFLSKYPDCDQLEKDQNIDFYHMGVVYDKIQNWFEEVHQNLDKKKLRELMKDYFDNYVEVIWYQVGQAEDSIQLFTRLNRGRIPLTDAELVKALLLQKNPRDQSKSEGETREVISMRWEEMEAELHKDSFWLFLTNKDDFRYCAPKYRTRIELVLELAAEAFNETKIDSRDELRIFRIFEKKYQEGGGRQEIWKKIKTAFLQLKGWYENQDLYHKIGFLIASESLISCEKDYSIFGIYKSFLEMEIYKDKSFVEDKDSGANTNIKNGESDKSFNDWLNEGITKCVTTCFAGKDSILDFSYDREKDKGKMQALLLLFNVETMRTNGKRDQRFPFHIYKDVDFQNPWSLEHIHAQNSEELKDEETKQKWENEYNSFIKGDYKSQKEKDHLKEICEHNKKEYDSGKDPKIHDISNMALIKLEDNTELGNQTFDEKRDTIARQEADGSFIPICTRRVFSKYYTKTAMKTAANSVHFLFWGPEDRWAYVKAIEDTLDKYLPQNEQNRREEK